MIVMSVELISTPRFRWNNIKGDILVYVTKRSTLKTAGREIETTSAIGDKKVVLMRILKNE